MSPNAEARHRRRVEGLLRRASASDRLDERRLLLAAAVTVALGPRFVVVGGAAEQYWIGGEYYATDVDMCPEIGGTDDERRLRAAGFEKEGRHWVHRLLNLGVEFPGPGSDIERTITLVIEDVPVTMIGREDLYLDRLRQATAKPTGGVEYNGAFAVVVANYEDMDWPYISERIDRAAELEPIVGAAMKPLNDAIREHAEEALLRQESI